jgi:hypothetical protein
VARVITSIAIARAKCSTPTVSAILVALALHNTVISSSGGGRKRVGYYQWESMRRLNGRLALGDMGADLRGRLTVQQMLQNAAGELLEKRGTRDLRELFLRNYARIINCSRATGVGNLLNIGHSCLAYIARDERHCRLHHQSLCVGYRRMGQSCRVSTRDGGCRRYACQREEGYENGCHHRCDAFACCHLKPKKDTFAMNSFCRCRSSALSRAVARRRRRASGSGQEIPGGIRLHQAAGLNLPGPASHYCSHP